MRPCWLMKKSANVGIRQIQLRVRGRGRWSVIMLWVLLLPWDPLWAQPPQPPLSSDPLTDADQILSFAEALFEGGDYFRAITEYKRFLFLYPTDPRTGRAHLHIGLSYLRGQQWEDARRTFQTIAQQHPGEEVGREAAFLVGETAYSQGDYARAIRDL